MLPEPVQHVFIHTQRDGLLADRLDQFRRVPEIARKPDSSGGELSRTSLSDMRRSRSRSARPRHWRMTRLVTSGAMNAWMQIHGLPVW
jgi:hypothetical protein